jgi:hypothetical protein
VRFASASNPAASGCPLGDQLPACEHRAALLLWLAGWDHDEIAEPLQLEDAGSADRLVRAGLWRPRDRLRDRERGREGRCGGRKIDMGV